MNRNLKFVLGALSLLAIPLLSMLLSIGGFDWTVSDFVIVAVLLAFAGYVSVYATSAGMSPKLRLIGFTVLGLIILLYVHLAVGLVDWLPFAGS